jgi:uncharacterized protein
VDGSEVPFWQRKTLAEMTKAEWESLCDGCGRCCLLKVEDEDTGDVYLTRLACHLLNLGTCRCGNYVKRREIVDDCVSLEPDMVAKLSWLPASCAYRRLEAGRGLAWWHPLVSGDPDSVHRAGISVRSFARSEKGVSAASIARYVIDDFDEE